MGAGTCSVHHRAEEFEKYFFAHCMVYSKAIRATGESEEMSGVIYQLVTLC